MLYLDKFHKKIIIDLYIYCGYLNVNCILFWMDAISEREYYLFLHDVTLNMIASSTHHKENSIFPDYFSENSFPFSLLFSIEGNIFLVVIFSFKYQCLIPTFTIRLVKNPLAKSHKVFLAFSYSSIFSFLFSFEIFFRWLTKNIIPNLQIALDYLIQW